jgi:hypothetical protein
MEMSLPSKFKLFTHKLTLYHQIVLKMPYFTSVPTEKRLNMDVLLQVKNLLQEFQSKRLHYNEVRWRQVGCSNDEDGELVVTMLDLGSLMPPGEDNVPNDYVRKHMTLLIKSNGTGIHDNRVHELLESLG